MSETEDSGATQPAAGVPFGRVSFDNLTPTEFEEFCVDLLRCLGYVNVDWRKGTPSASSPADQGRDIEAYLECEDRDGFHYNEKWNVDAKHYKSTGVPPEELRSLFTWSDEERPQVALVIASGFLTNPAKNYISGRIEKTRPYYRVRYWERPILQQLIERHPVLVERHNVTVAPSRNHIQIARARREYEDIVWYEQIQRSVDWVGDPTSYIDAQTQQRLEAIELRYPRERLYPWAVDGEHSRGRLSALRWIMGEEWRDPMKDSDSESTEGPFQ